MIQLTKEQKVMVRSIEAESGLIDGCKYMVYLNDGYEHYGYGSSFGIRNKRELLEFLEDVELVKVDDSLLESVEQARETLLLEKGTHEFSIKESRLGVEYFNVCWIENNELYQYQYKRKQGRK